MPAFISNFLSLLLSLIPDKPWLIENYNILQKKGFLYVLVGKVLLLFHHHLKTPRTRAIMNPSSPKSRIPIPDIFEIDLNSSLLGFLRRVQTLLHCTKNDERPDNFSFRFILKSIKKYIWRCF